MIVSPEDLNKDVTWRSRTGLTNDGQPLYGTPVTIKARVEEEQKLVLNDRGQEEPTDITIFTYEQNIKKGDQLVYGGTQHEVVFVSNEHDLNGSFEFAEVRA